MSAPDDHGLVARRWRAFADRVRAEVLARSQEGPDVFPEIEVPPHPTSDERFLLAVDGVPVAWTAPHGATLDWLQAS